MKDLYSFNRSKEDRLKFYEIAKAQYRKVYEDLGIGADTFLTVASGGDFTKDYSHEFQLLVDSGEDTIYLDRAKGIAYNRELKTEDDAKKLGVDFSKLEELRASEVGNIFPLGTKYTEAFDFRYVDENGDKQLVWMGSYGIGTSRIMGVMVEKFHDEAGIVWNENIAPFKYHLISLARDTESETYKEALKVYTDLTEKGLEVLWDDRLDVTNGEKFNDCDLIGCPYRLVVSDKTIKEKKIELKKRSEKESKLVEVGNL
jgi:prolyl-tRNA synthetase